MKKNMKKKRKAIKTILILLAALAVAGILAVLCVNAYVKNAVADRILSPEEAQALGDVDCILILGCGVKDDGTPSDMLRDRLQRGFALYSSGIAPKLLMSGDHGREDYNEVGVMKAWAVEAGVPSENVFMDHAGFSTYETVYRAREIFGVRKMVIVTQEYHLYRSLYIAEKLGMEVYGVSSDYHTYRNQTAKDAREVLARCKDWVKVMFRLEPTYLGDPIPISGNGDATND